MWVIQIRGLRHVLFLGDSLITVNLKRLLCTVSECFLRYPNPPPLPSPLWQGTFLLFGALLARYLTRLSFSFFAGFSHYIRDPGDKRKFFKAYEDITGEGVLRKSCPVFQIETLNRTMNRSIAIVRVNSSISKIATFRDICIIGGNNIHLTRLL